MSKIPAKYRALHEHVWAEARKQGYDPVKTEWVIPMGNGRFTLMVHAPGRTKTGRKQVTIKVRPYKANDPSVRRRRDPSGRLLSDVELRKQGADSIEYLYDDGRASKKDVIAWVRLSAKLSGRIYEPGFQSRGGPTGFGRVRLRRREDLEEKMYTKKAGYWKTRRDVVPSPRRDKDVEKQFLLGILEAMWMDSYMSWADETGHGHRTGHIPQHVRQLSDIPQAPPIAAKKLAAKYASLLVKLNKATLTQIWVRACKAEGRKHGDEFFEVDPAQLGFYLTMQSAGHGIGWTDDHASFPLTMPSAEWHAYGPKGRVSFQGWVSERLARRLR